MGTSIGGVLALGMVYGNVQFIHKLFTLALYHSMYVGKKSLAEMRQFLFRACEDVFKDPRGGLVFDTDALEKMFMGVSATIRMSDIKYPRCL